MQSSLLANGEKTVCMGTSSMNEMSVNDKRVVAKLLEGVTDEKYLAASAKEREKLVEQVELAGSSLGYREVATNSVCAMRNKQNVPKSYTSLAQHQRFIADTFGVNILFLFGSLCTPIAHFENQLNWFTRF